MDHETLKALIQKYTIQIEGLQNAVRLLEVELNSNGSKAASVAGKTPPVNGHIGKDVDVAVKQWEFANKSQTDAAEEVLMRVGHPMSVGDLLESLERGGMKVGGGTVLQKRSNLATQLARSGRFGKAARGTWGLPSWRNIQPVKFRTRRSNSKKRKAKPASA